MSNIKQRQGYQRTDNDDRISHTEMLNEDGSSKKLTISEQDQLIDDFKKQDEFYNLIYRITMTLFSVAAAAYYGWLMVETPHVWNASFISCICLIISPTFVILATPELVWSNIIYQACYISCLAISLTPLLLTKRFEYFWGIPFAIYCLNGMIIYDMCSVTHKIGSLSDRKYRLKGA